jgi:hypothetical protein
MIIAVLAMTSFATIASSCGEYTPIVVERHVIALAGKRTVKILNRSALEDRMKALPQLLRISQA